MATQIKGSGIKTLGPGKSVEIKPEFHGTNERQTQFVVGNASSLASGNDLYVVGDNEQEAIPIPPKQAVIIEGDALIKIKAADVNVGDASYTVGQIFGGRISLDR